MSYVHNTSNSYDETEIYMNPTEVTSAGIIYPQGLNWKKKYEQCSRCCGSFMKDGNDLYRINSTLILMCWHCMQQRD